MAIENISQDVADLLATKDYDVKYTDGQGKDSSPEEAKTFAFDWVAGSGQNYGTVVIVLGNDNDLQLFFGDNLGKTMDNPQDKLDWFGSERETGFLPELKNFATQHRYTFSPKNINQLKHNMQGMAAIKEGLFEGYYGTRRVSYVGEPTAARLVIKHNRMIGEDDKRYRYVESLFIETVDGERFRLPFVKLSGGRAMLEHVKQGGKPYDIRGQHINEIVSEMAVLNRFNRASQQRVFEGVTQELVETVQHYYGGLRENLQHLATVRGYTQYFESWTPADIGDGSALVEDLKTMFIEQTLDARIEAALPTLAKIQQQGNAMKEAEIFENWANRIMEGIWALPDTPEAQAKLNELMSQELIVGPDATNATEQLYDIIGDDLLFDILGDLAEQDPRANIWDDTDVQARLQELGIQLNTTPEDGNNIDNDREQGMAEGSVDQLPTHGADYSKYDTDHLKMMLRPGILHRNEARFKALIRKELQKREQQSQQGVAEGSLTDKQQSYWDNVAKEKKNKEHDALKAKKAEHEKTPIGKAEKYWGKNGVAEGLNEFAQGDFNGGDDSNDLQLYLNVAKKLNMKKYKPSTAHALIAKKMAELVDVVDDDKVDYARHMARKAQGLPNMLEQGVAEGSELATILKYAGVPLRESVLTDSTGHTLDHILKRFSREVRDFEASGELDDNLYDALYDYYFDDMPYGTKKARDGDPYEYVSQRLADELGINEGAAVDAYMAGKSPALAHFADQLDKSAEIKEGTCNLTMEGEYCPEHGLAKCGSMSATVNAFAESRAGDALLARITSLALIR